MKNNRRLLRAALSLAMAAAFSRVMAVDGTFRPTSDLQANNSWLDAQWWVDGTVATGVGATATLSPGKFCRFTADRDGWTLGHFRQTDGDVYLYPGAGAWLTMDAGSGAVSEMATTAFKCGANLRYLTPLRLTGSGTQFFGRNEFAAGAWPILEAMKEFYLKRGDDNFGHPEALLSDGAEGAGAIVIDGTLKTMSGEFSGTLDYRATRPFGGGFYTRHGLFAYTPCAWPVESAAAPAALPGGCILHLDAANEASLERVNGSQLARWKDLSGSENDAVASGRTDFVMPEIWEREIREKPVVSLGGYYANSPLRASLKFEKSVSLAKKTLFWVVGSEQGGGSLLGNEKDGTRVYRRGGSGGTDRSDPLLAEAMDGLTFRVNGQAVVDPTATGLSGSYDIVTLVASEEAAGSFAGLACDTVGATIEADGHMKLAEFLVFDGVLDDDAIRGVEAHLADKWLKGRTDIRRHYVLGTETFDVAASDRTPVIQDLQGPGSFVKTGAGSVRIEKPFAFGGQIKLVGGTLELGAGRPAARFDGERKLPTDGLVLHFDASDASTLDVTNGFVQTWRDKATGITADSSADGAKAPFYGLHAVNGRPGVDLGEVGSGRFVKFSTRIENAKTVMVVGDSRRGGGYYISGTTAMEFERSVGGVTSLANPFRQTSSFFNTQNWNLTYLNGKSVPSNRTHPQGGPEIVTVSSLKELAFDRIGKDRDIADRSGGQVIGEYVAWNRNLTDAERLAAEAYLHDKWFGDAPDVKGLAIAGDVTLKTDGDVTVGGIEGAGTLTKTGKGTLTVNTLGLDFDISRLTVAEGAVVVRADKGEAPTELPVADPLIWTDASDESSFTLDGDEVTAWADVRGNGWVATSTKASSQRLFRNELNGRAVLDTADTNAGIFKWPASEKGLRTLFFVKGSIPRVNNQNGGCLLYDDGGRSKGWGRINYSMKYDLPILSVFFGNSVQAGLHGRFWLGGVQVSPFTTGYNGGYQLVSVEAAGYPLSADSFANGQQIAEFIAYDRELTDAERQAVEAYLARKWFRKGLHGYVVPDEKLPGRTLASDERLAVAPVVGETNRVGWIAGTGALVKEGAGCLSLAGSTAGFDGVLDIREGAVVYEAPKYTGTLPTINGLIARFDADQTDSLTFYEGADAAVIRSWSDVSGRYTATNCWYTAGRKELQLTGGDANGHSAVQFGVFGKSSSLHLMETIPDVRTVFAALGTQEGKGAFIQNVKSDWHPGYQNGWGSTQSSIFNDVNLADWLRVNGEGPYLANETDVLKPDVYQLVSVQRRKAASVEMFGSDRHINNGEREGGFRIGELIFVSEAVDDEARQDIEAYLGYKWLAAPVTNRNYMVAETAHAGSLSVASGAVFDLNGFTQTVGGLSGGGLIRGDVTLADDAVWTFAPGETLRVTGTLTLPRKGMVRPRAGASAASEGLFKIAEADALVLPRDLKSWRTIETDKRGVRWITRIQVSGNAVYAVCAQCGGMIILIR